MTLSWLECLIYGLISGFAEFIPVSSLAHQALYLKLLGKENDPLLRCCAYLGAVLAVLLCCRPTLERLRKERRIAAQPRKRRRRQPDVGTLLESKVLRTASLSMLVLFLGWGLTERFSDALWLIAVFAALNGIVLYVPQYLPGANKTAQSLSGLDAMLIGLAAGCGILPGISTLGAAASTALVRGTDRRYAVELGLLLTLPALLVMALLTAFSAVPALAAFSGGLLLRCITVTAAAFGTAYLGISLVRFLAVRLGFGAIAYYCWGFALFSLILFLI